MATEESELRELFARLRYEDMQRIPAFDETVGRSQARPRESRSFIDSWRWWVPVTALASAGLWLGISISKEPSVFDPGVAWEPGQWMMPTDVLLDLSSLPAAALMRDFELDSSDLGPIRDDASRSSEIRDRHNGGPRHVRSLG